MTTITRTLTVIIRDEAPMISGTYSEFPSYRSVSIELTAEQSAKLSLKDCEVIERSFIEPEQGAQ